MKYSIELTGYGGEFTFGTIVDEKIFDALENKMYKNDLSAFDDKFSFYDFNNILCENGPYINYADIEVILEDQQEKKSVKVAKNYKLKYVIYDRPIMSNKKYPEAIGYYGGASIERGVFGSYSLETNKKIKLKNLFAYCTSLKSTHFKEYYYWNERNVDIVSGLIYLEEDILFNLLEKNKKYGKTFEEIFVKIKPSKRKELIEKHALKYEANINTTGKNSYVKFYTFKGKEITHKRLVQEKKDLEKYPHKPLHRAVISNQLDVIKQMHLKGDQMDLSDVSGNTPILVAARKGRLEILKYLVEEVGQDSSDLKVLEEACESAYVDIVDYLISINNYKENELQNAFQELFRWSSYLKRRIVLWEYIQNNYDKIFVTSLIGDKKISWL